MGRAPPEVDPTMPALEPTMPSLESVPDTVEMMDANAGKSPATSPTDAAEHPRVKRAKPRPPPVRTDRPRKKRRKEKIDAQLASPTTTPGTNGGLPVSTKLTRAEMRQQILALIDAPLKVLKGAPATTMSGSKSAPESRGQEPDESKLKVENPDLKYEANEPPNLPEEMDEWTKYDVSQWLCSLGSVYKRYEQDFYDNGVDGEILAIMDHEMLQELKVSGKLHRIAILLAIKRWSRTPYSTMSSRSKIWKQ